MRARVPYLLLALLVFVSGRAAAAQAPPVRASEDADILRMDNGAVALEVSRRTGEITSIRYRHEGHNTEMGKPGDAMYFDSNGGPREAPPDAGTRPRAGYQRLVSYLRSARLAESGPETAEVVLAGGPSAWFPFYNEIHYVLRRGEPGFYAYALYQHGAQMPAAGLGQTRFVIRGPAGTGLYTHHVVDDRRKGPFPTSPVVRQVMDATFLLQDGTVYTKYDNTIFEANHHVHGMAGHGVGIWMVTASNEYVNGGPVKQELSVHMDNTLLWMLQGGHFGAGGLEFGAGEEWSKLYGPCFVYLNHADSVDALWADAKRRAQEEVRRWPYAWLKRADYPLERGTVEGRLRLTDGGSPAGAWVVLGAPGGDWPRQGKGYLFWAQADSEGRFSIPKVRPGRYTLYAYGADQFEQLAREGVEVAAGRTTDLHTVEWHPITHGRRIWQIGTPDRSTREFRNGDDVRHWANYMRYPGDFPDDVTFTIGQSSEKTDWNFAQWTWYCKRPFWRILFALPAPSGARPSSVPRPPSPLCGGATLTLGFASTLPVSGRVTNLQVKVNGQEVAVLHLPKSGEAGYRSGGQDSTYRVEYVTFDAVLLKPGANEITLGHLDAQLFPSREEQMRGHVGEVMYDAIRLEVSPP